MEKSVSLRKLLQICPLLLSGSIPECNRERIVEVECSYQIQGIDTEAQKLSEWLDSQEIIEQESYKEILEIPGEETLAEVSNSLKYILFYINCAITPTSLHHPSKRDINCSKFIKAYQNNGTRFQRFRQVAFCSTLDHLRGSHFSSSLC